MKYQTTKGECQKKIDELGNVCNRCGRKITPLKTVDNCGQPTYWPGCMHGQVEKGAWGHFSSGAKKDIYDLAVKLVLGDSNEFGMSYEDKETKDFDYAWQNAVSRACDKVGDIEWMKNNNPRYSKKQIRQNFDKYFKYNENTKTKL